MVHDGFYPDGGSDVCFAGAGTANEYDILGLIQELAAMQGSDQCFVYSTVGKREAGKATMGRNNQGSGSRLPESNREDMEVFLEKVTRHPSLEKSNKTPIT
jgi:hypothetical protein